MKLTLVQKTVVQVCVAGIGLALLTVLAMRHDAAGAGIALSLTGAIGTFAVVGLIGVSIVRSVPNFWGGDPEAVAAIAARMAAGDLTIPIVTKPGDSTSVLASLTDMSAPLKHLTATLQAQSEAAARQEFGVRGDLTKHRGEFGRVVEFSNEILDAVVNKMEWYRSIVDAVPFPIHVMDLDMNWTFLNKAFEKLMVERGYVRDRQDAVGRACSTANANICKTKNCGVMQMRAGVNESYFDWGNLKCKQDTAPVRNAKGETVGYVETVSDLTAVLGASEKLQEAVKETQEVVRSAIDGNLQLRIPLQGKSGEIEALCTGVNTLLDATMSLVKSIKNATSEVQAGAQEIARGNTDLSQRTEQQASSLEETASSMEEMTSSVKQTADNAGQANQLASAARQQAEAGGTIVSDAVTAMSEINTSSKKIADIIGVIDEIAFQTNLLALNAAVEAARAGEQGRGFAVVASEVRNLAGRSATAAKEIKELIRDSVSKVEEGSRLVDESGKALHDIVSAVKRVTDIVSEIAAASAEQSSGIEQVSKSVTSMDEVTQQNAALVEQAAAASQSIVDQSNTLSELVARYQVGELSEAQGQVAKLKPVSAPSVGERARRRPAVKLVKAGRSTEVHIPVADIAMARKVAGKGSEGESDWTQF